MKLLKIILPILLVIGFAFGQSNLGITDGQVTMQNNAIDAFDDVGGAIVTIDFVHHEIHEGDHFITAGAFSLGSTDTALVVLDVADTTKRTHLIYTLNTVASTTIDLFEGGDYARAPDAITAYNSDRDSSTESVRDTLFVIHNDSTLVDRYNTLMFTYEVGAGQKTTGELGRGQELILASDSTYFWRITSNAASNIVGYILEWYEHTDR